MMKFRKIVAATLFLLIFAGQVHSRPLYDEYRHQKIDESVYQVVLDVEDTCFEFLSGDWYLYKSGSWLNYFYFAIDGPGTGSGQARWIAEGLPAGSYLIEFHADNGDYAEDARYQVIGADGVDDLMVDMNYIAAGWHTLGTYNLDRVCVVNVSDYWTGAGSKLSVDALRFTLQSPLPAPPASSVTPHIGVCIDDAGSVNPTSSSTPIYKMLRLGFPMTFAVMPYRSYTNQTAEEVFTRGSEVILHEPMAAVTVANPGTGGITDAMTLEQVRSTISTNLDAMPHCIGMNNHMGSLITQQVDKMQVCMEELKARDMFWFDSRTITTSVAYDVAKDNGLLTAERDLFIDGSNKTEAKELIRSLAVRALNAPEVPHLAIGHVRTDTADAIQEMLPELAAMGVEIWPISRCMEQIIEVDRIPDGATVTYQGSWSENSNNRYSKQLFDGFSKVITDPANTASDSVTFRPYLPIDGDYDIYAAWPLESNNSAEIQATIIHNIGSTQLNIDQSAHYGDWYHLGRYSFSSGDIGSILLDDSQCTDPGKIFWADSVRFVYRGPATNTPVGIWYTY